jgi:DNA polymerase
MTPGAPATLADIEREALGCTRCVLAGGRTQVVFGVGDRAADLMFVGEGPGREEDLRGEPFVGRSGKLLDRLVREELGIPRERCYIANVVKCRPPGNRDPQPAEVAACRPWLEAQVRLIAPRVIVTLGNFASRLLLDRTEGVTRLRGRVYPSCFGAPEDGGEPPVIVPTYHPSAALRSGGEVVAGMRADLIRAKEHLAAHSPRTPGSRAGVPVPHAGRTVLEPAAATPRGAAPAPGSGAP